MKLFLINALNPCINFDWHFVAAFGQDRPSAGALFMILSGHDSVGLSE